MACFLILIWFIFFGSYNFVILQEICFTIRATAVEFTDHFPHFLSELDVCGHAASDKQCGEDMICFNKLLTMDCVCADNFELKAGKCEPIHEQTHCTEGYCLNNGNCTQHNVNEGIKCRYGICVCVCVWFHFDSVFSDCYSQLDTFI